MKIEDNKGSNAFNNFSNGSSNEIEKQEQKLIHDSNLLCKKECIYIYDIASNTIIEELNFTDFLGFKEGAFSLDFRYSLIHPDDVAMVSRIEQAALKYCMEGTENNLENVLFITYRLRKNDSSYIKVLRKSSIYKNDDLGKPIHVIMKLTDIAFMDTTNQIRWLFQGQNVNSEKFKKHIYDAYENFFTSRETDIIKEIQNRLTNNEIAKTLSISKHTVATHRKNILKKCGRHNTKDLLFFCKQKGILY